jgi:hypothetical protein
MDDKEVNVGEDRTDKSLAQEASRLFSDASTKFSASVTGQAASIALEYRGDHSPTMPPSVLREKLLSDDRAIQGLIILAHRKHSQVAAGELGQMHDSASLTDEQITSHMAIKGMPNQEEIETKIRGIIGDTFNLAQRLMILPDDELAGVIEDYDRFHSRLLKDDGKKEDQYRSSVEKKLKHVLTPEASSIPTSKGAMRMSRRLLAPILRPRDII